MNTNAGCAEIHAFGFPALAKFLRPTVQRMCAGNRAARIIRLVARRVKENLDCIADDLRDRALVREHNIGHPATYSLSSVPSTSGAAISTNDVKVGENRGDLAPVKFHAARAVGRHSISSNTSNRDGPASARGSQATNGSKCPG